MWMTRPGRRAASRLVMRLQGKKVLRRVEEPGDGWAVSNDLTVVNRTEHKTQIR